MRTFEKYIEHVKLMFKPYKRCVVKERVKGIDREIITIVPAEHPAKPLAFGEVGIIFDQETIGFFGDFFPDEYLDEFFDNSWEKYSEKQIFQFLDKKIEEYKYYIDNGYFFAFCYSNNEVEALWPHVYTGDFNKIDYEKLYLSQNSEGVDYDQIKSVTVTNFYGDIIVDNKILH